ncbi:MAG TPA: type II toxin-antitoxin system death-on-curing family toxin [Pyrinomonadaceae bacterium]
MATEEVVYLSFAEAVLAHIELMRYLGETRYGVFDRTLVESTLARPQQAAAYESADLLTQAATLLYGLVKNHPWVGGNKRTATLLTQLFLRRNGFKIVATIDDILELVLAIESDQWQSSEIAIWLHSHVLPL